MGMFSSKSPTATQPKAQRNVDTVIGSGAVFDGDLHTKNSVCIEGTVRGHLRCEGRVILNKSGVVEADVGAEYITVNGTVRGNVKAGKQLDVGETGVIQGDVEAAAITIAKGGTLRGACNMAPEQTTKSAPTRSAPANPARGNGAAKTGTAKTTASAAPGVALQ